MSSPTTGDLLLVNRGGTNYKIDFDDMSTLQDTDLLLVNRGGVNYKMEAVDLGLAPRTIESPVEVLTPLDGAGDPDLIYLKSDTITAVDSDGGNLQTDGISSIDTTTAAPNTILSFPSSNNLELFTAGDQVKSTGSEAAFIATSFTDTTNAFDQAASLDTTWVPDPATYPGWVNIGSEFGTSFSAVGQNKHYKSANNYSTGKKLICVTIGVSLDSPPRSPLNFIALGLIPTSQAAASKENLADSITATCGDGQVYVKIDDVETPVPGQNNVIATGGVASQRFAFGYDFDSNRAYVWVNNEALTNLDIDAVHPDLETFASVVSVDTNASTVTVDSDAFVVFEPLLFPYDVKLNLAGDTDLSLMSTGAAVMTDGVLGGTGYTQTAYTLTTSAVSSTTSSGAWSSTAGSTDISFDANNTDLQYFQVGDNLGTQQLWDQSKQWSTLITSIYSDHGGNANAFDGVVDRSSSAFTSSSSSPRWIQCNTAMAVNGRVRVMTIWDNYDTCTISVTDGNSTVITTEGPALDADGFIDLGIHSGTLDYVRVDKGRPGTVGAGLCAIEVNNKLLVDSSVSGTSTADIIVSAVDTSANTLTVSNSPPPYSVGDVITLATNGGSGNIVSIDAAASEIYLTSTVSLDRWIGDNKAGTAFALAAGSTTYPPAPTAAGATFTSSNAGTTAFSGGFTSLSSRTWTVETAADKTGPWSLVGTYTDTDPVASQDGATAWTTTRPTLSADTWYRVKVEYNASGADSVESDYHIFKTAV